jgi:hypothetical protein
MDRDVIQWREGDWIGDSDIVEILPADDDAELTALDASRKQSGPDAVDTQPGEIADIARQIRQILERNKTGKGRVLLGPEAAVLQLLHLADRLGVIAGELATA